MRICPVCKQALSPENFYENKKTRVCKPCKRARNSAWVAKNPDKNRAIKKASKRRCYTIEKRRREYDAPGYRERNRARVAEWRSANRNIARANSNRRKKIIRQRTPPWLSHSEKEYIAGIYLRAQETTMESGEQFQVDHIIPLRGKLVSGLHVPWNLRLLSSEANRRKQATFTPLTIVGPPR